MRNPISPRRECIRLNIIIPVAVIYILGGALAGFFHPGNSLLGCLSILALLLIAGLFLLRRHPDALTATLPLFLLLGFIHTGNALHPPESPAHVYNLITEKSKVTLSGIVTGMPEFDGRTTRLEMETDTLLFHGQKAEAGKQIPAHGRVRLSIDDDLRGMTAPGDHLLLMATLNRTANYRTPGVFDYRLYLANRSIYVTGTIPSREAIIRYLDLDKTGYAQLRSYPERIRHSLGIFLESRLEPEKAGLYKALLIGSRRGIGEETLEKFRATGCMHLLAISGIHMGLLGMIVVLLLTRIMKRSTYLLNHLHIPTAATLMTLPVLFGYAFIAGMNTPVLRALIMSTFFLFAIVLRRQRSIMHIIAAAALLLLMARPLALFTASFQLSFSAVMAIAILYPRLPLLVEQQTTTLSRISAAVQTALLVSIAATLGSLPFMLFHFNRFSPIGPFVNLLIEPFLCLWALPAGLIALPFTQIAPEFAAILLKAGSYGITAAMQIVSLGSRIPFASLWSITPDAVEILLYYGILLTWIYSAAIPGKKRTAFIISALFMLYFTRGLWLTMPGRITEIAYLDIGQGSSTFIRMPMGRAILLDGGNNSSTSFDAGARIIAPYLWKKKIWRLDEVIISHPHSDHYNGLNFILRHFHPKRFWINGRETDMWPYRDLLQTAARLNIPVLAPGMAELEFSDGQAALSALRRDEASRAEFSAGESAWSVNDWSLVLRLRHGRYTFLFPGDIGVEREKALVKGGTNVKADVLLAPHHGSGGSGSRIFLSAVDPEIIIVSAGKNSAGRYPSPEHLQEWQHDGRTVLETSRVGTVTLLSDGGSLKITTQMPDASGPRNVKPR